MSAEQFELEQCQKKIEELEKSNRILAKKLERSQVNLAMLEETNDRKEALLNQVIHDLKDSETNLANRSQELEQALEKLQTMQTKMLMTEKMSALGTLVAGIAHEINNPVNFIHANLDYVEQYIQDLLQIVQLCQEQTSNLPIAVQAAIKEADLEFLQQDLTKILHSMQGGTDRIMQIVLSLRNFSRLDEAAYKLVDIHDGIDSTLMLLQYRLKGENKQPGIKIVKNYDQLPLIRCYAGELNQVFMNILSNAIDAFEDLEDTNDTAQLISETKTPTITITSKMNAYNQVQIAIADNGCGMTEEVRSRIFNPFFSTKPVGKGTGLGLSISYQIITEKHKGHILCESTPGEGTQFTLIIPISSKTEDPSEIEWI